jgi:hypothetical protein
MASDPNAKISREIEAAKALKAAIGSDAEDAALLSDMIEGETGLFELIDAMLNLHFSDVELLKGINDRKEALEVRQKRIKERVDYRKAKLEQALAIFGEKIERPEATLYLAKRAPALIVTDESEIPSQYWKQPPLKLNQDQIKKDLKEGVSIPGVTLNNSPETVTIRPR